MKVMVLVKSNPEYEAGAMPKQELLAAMGRFNEQLVNAGVMLAGEGLQPSSKGKRVRFGGKGAKKTVVGGPFPATGELVGGFWLWKVNSIDEAVDWLKKAPFENEEVEIRPVSEAEDFGEELTPELRAQEDRVRAKLAKSGRR